MKTIFHIVTAGLVGLLLSSCFTVPGRHKCYAKPVAGRVIDYKTGKGVAGAKISFSPYSVSYSSKQRICPPHLTSQTDHNGFFMITEARLTPTCSFANIDFPVSLRFSTAAYLLDVSANGYQSAHIAIAPVDVLRFDNSDEEITTSSLQSSLIDSGFVIVMLHAKPKCEVTNPSNDSEFVIVMSPQNHDSDSEANCRVKTTCEGPK